MHNKIAKDPLKAPEWMLEAACALPANRGVNFFPERNESNAAAKRVCLSCPVQSECTDYAIIFDMEGVWGGMSGKQRERKYPPKVRRFVREDYFGTEVA